MEFAELLSKESSPSRSSFQLQLRVENASELAGRSAVT